MTPKVVISIGRQFGSGGRILGNTIAKRLGIKFYDNELITRAAAESGVSEQIIREKDERPVQSSFFKNIQNLLPGGSSTLSDENIFKIQSDTIRKLAAESSCVIMGRCSDYVLRDYKYLVTIFFWSPMEDRIQRVCERCAISDKDKARDLIESEDADRAKYYNYFTGKTWGDSRSYNFCMDVSLLGLERTTEFTIRLLKAKFGDLIKA